MKKGLLILPLVALSILNTSCSSSNKIAFLKGDGNEALISTVTSQGTETDLIKMLDRKNSFIFYISDPTCSSCVEFENMLSNYLPNSKLLIYKLLNSIYSKMDSTIRRKYSLPSTVFTPALFIVNNGKITTQLNYQNNEAKFTDKNEFEKFLSKYGKITNNTFVSNYKTSSSNETIYLPDSLESPFSASFSGNVVMYETISANYNKKLINLDSSYYVYDITGTIVNKNNEIDETKVTAFKTNYNINQDYNFPVVVNFVNGTVTSANSL